MRPRSTMAALAAALLAVTACGGDDGDSTTESGDGDAPATTQSADAGDDAGDDGAGDDADDDAGDADTGDGADEAGDDADEPTDGDAGAAAGECTADRTGGSIVFGVPGQPNALDPISIAGSATTGGLELIQMYDVLLTYDPDTGQYEPHVAESFGSSDDFTVWTVTLRDGVSFGNGDPLNADAVVASFERFQENATGAYSALATRVAEVTAVDDLTVEFELAEPWSGFPFTLANTPGMIVNTAVADEAGEAFGTDPAGAGVGPYEVTRYASGEEVVLTAKDDYWGGPVCIEEISFVPLPSDSGRYEAFQTGEFDATWLRDPFVIGEAENDGVSGLVTFQNAQNVLLFNQTDDAGITTDPRFRRAVSMIIDPVAIAERTLEGRGNPTSALIGENSFYYQGLEGPQVDTDAAAELLDELRDEGWDGSVHLTCAVSSEDTALAIVAQLEAAGVEVDLELLPDFGVLFATVGLEKNFDVACWGLNIIDDGIWATLNNSLSSTSPSNYSGYGDDEMDAALDDLRVAETEEEVLALLETIQERWIETVPAIILNAGPNVTILSDEIQGVQQTGNSLVLFGDAYLEQ
ncbi:MAG: ABC transporter substrate-binding protein [Ilumatobacteraceae bacterium]